MSALMDEMRAFAEATGKTVIVGCRGHNGTWFAHCDGIEYDGSNPLGSVRAVRDGWVERARSRAAQAAAEASQAEAALAALDADR